MSSLLSLIIGTVVGLTQFRIKRLLAYSTISHVGFILLSLSNIFGSLFANELLNYFDLENKFPSITGFLKLRAKFQKYYLSWDIFFLLILIIAAIFLNIFIFIVC